MNGKIFIFAIMAMGICLNNFYEDYLGAIELFMQHIALLFKATLFFGSLIGLLLIAEAIYGIYAMANHSRREI